MGRPPEPFIEKSFGPSPAPVLPEFPEGFLQQIGPVAPQIQIFQIAETGALFVRKILGILEPDVSRPLEQFGIGAPQFPGFSRRTWSTAVNKCCTM